MSAKRSWPIPEKLLSSRAYIENIEPSFMASPMSPLSFSLPDMNSIWGFCFPVDMSIQSWAPTCSVRLGLAAWPVLTEHRSEEHTSELQSHHDLVCRLLLEKKNTNNETKHSSNNVQ